MSQVGHLESKGVTEANSEAWDSATLSGLRATQRRCSGTRCRQGLARRRAGAHLPDKLRVVHGTSCRQCALQWRGEGCRPDVWVLRFETRGLSETAKSWLCGNSVRQRRVWCGT